MERKGNAKWNAKGTQKNATGTRSKFFWEVVLEIMEENWR